MQAPFGVGDRIGGKYRVESVLGEGGMGVVLAARHEALDLRVAVKLLRDGGDDERANARFLREARLAARLRSAHAVRVHDFGVERETPYIVMELLDGEPLKSALARGPMATETLVLHLLDVCIALAEGHALGIVHRDVKPSNVFLERRPDGTTRARLVDFGIAKPHLPESTTLTENDASLGTPQYMAPEQIRDARRVDARADLWSLGVILYEALSGALPFEGYTPAGYLASVLSDAAVPLTTRAPSVDPSLAAIAARLLEKDPAKRPASAADVAHALGPFGGPEGPARALEAARVSDETLSRKDERAQPRPEPPAPARDQETATGTRVDWATHPASGALPRASARPRTRVLPLAAAALVVMGLGYALTTGLRGNGAITHASVAAGAPPSVEASAASPPTAAPPPSTAVAPPPAPEPTPSGAPTPSAAPPASAAARIGERPAATAAPTAAVTSAKARPRPAPASVDITDWGARK